MRLEGVAGGGGGREVTEGGGGAEMGLILCSKWICRFFTWICSTDLDGCDGYWFLP